MLGQVISYARVSSNGQNLDVQIDKLKNFGCYKIYQEKLSGLDQNRPELIKCIEYLREGDTLMITKLDRLARWVTHLNAIVDKLKAQAIEFVVLDHSIDTTTPSGKLMFHILSAFAEFENELRKERQLEGIEKAKQKGVKIGRPRKIDNHIKKQLITDIAQQKPTSTILKKYQLARSTYFAFKKKYKNQIEKMVIL